MNNRDPFIDFLRFIGLSCIILAHVYPPYFLGQLRSFDVPLMLFVSGLSFSGKSISNYWQYVWGRLKRLLIPVWSFLFVYLTIFFFSQSFFLPEPYLTPRMIVRSFLLLDESIGYVWIIRVFILIMLVTPLLQIIEEQAKKSWQLIFVMACFLGITSGIYAIQNLLNNTICTFVFGDVIQYTVAYSIPFLLGLRMRRMKNRKEELFFELLLICICGTWLFYMLRRYGFDISSSYKFPPRSNFLLYGILVCVIAWISRDFWTKSVVEFRLFNWIGKNTIWIYLWHMPIVLMANHYLSNWVVKYIIVYILSICVFGVQYWLIKKINSPFMNKHFIG